MKNSILLLCAVAFCSALPAAGQDWQFFEVEDGVKPALDLTSADVPHISFMLESHSGFVKHAIWDPALQDFNVTLVSEGYFYGPLGLALDPFDAPHISYHDHTLQDQVQAFLAATFWRLARIEHPGHDGWDNAIVIDKRNRVHTATVDPSGFGGDGIEYALGSEVEVVGSGPIMYANGTSLAIDSQENPHLTYYNDNTQRLKYAMKIDGNWRITTVDSSGDAGRFSSLKIDASDVSHVSYYQALSEQTGIVKYAKSNGAAWEITVIDSLDNVFVGFAGARNMTSLALDSEGMPHLSYSDEKVLKLAHWNGTAWQRETVMDFSNQNRNLGQLTSLQLDSQDKPHVAYYEVNTKSPLTGVVYYATQNVITAVRQQAIVPRTTSLAQNFPNPFNPSTTLTYTIQQPAHANLSVFDTRGRLIRTLVDEFQTKGEYSVTLAGSDLGSGVYLIILKVNDRLVNVRKAVLLK